MKISGTVTKGGVAVQGAKVSLFRQGLRQTLFGGSHTQLNTGVDTFFSPWHQNTAQTTNGGTYKRSVSKQGVLTDLKITLDAQPGGGKSYTFVLYQNNNPTSMSVTISGTDTTGEDITHSVQVDNGDILQFVCTPSGTPAAARVRNSIVFFSTPDDEFSVSAGNGSISGTATIYLSLDSSGTSSGLGSAIKCPLAGTLKNFYINLSVAPGTGLTRTFTVMYGTAGATASDLVITISDSSTSGSDTAHTLAVVPGDVLRIKSEVSGSLAASDVLTRLTFVSSVSGRYWIGGSTPSNLSTTDTEYFKPTAGSTATAQYLSEQRFTKDITIKNMYVEVSAAPGTGGSGKKRTFTLMQNGNPTALTFDILETATTNNITTDVVCAEGDLFELQSVPTSSPAAATSRYGFMVSTSSTELIEAQLTDASGDYSFTSLTDIEHGYHTTVEFGDGNGKYNAKSLPFLDPVAE